MKTGRYDTQVVRQCAMSRDALTILLQLRPPPCPGDPLLAILASQVRAAGRFVIGAEGDHAGCC